MRETTTLLRRAALAGGLAAALGGASARADDNGLVMAGKTVAQTWCANCHVIADAQTRGSDQAPTWTSIANRPGTTSDTLHGVLAHPHGKMPDFKLGNGEIDAVVAYILSLKG
jgi:mono/diheme cytochrome c family protein